MEATILKIDPEHLRFKPMSRSARTKLRHENIKALIRSKPAGTIIRNKEFQVVTSLPVANCFSMVKTMVSRGEITKTLADGKKALYTYTVNGDEKVTKPRRIVEPKEGFDTETLIEKAKSYAWETNDDSLRAFIKWLAK